MILWYNYYRKMRKEAIMWKWKSLIPMAAIIVFLYRKTVGSTQWRMNSWHVRNYAYIFFWQITQIRSISIWIKKFLKMQQDIRKRLLMMLYVHWKRKAIWSKYLSINLSFTLRLSALTAKSQTICLKKIKFSIFRKFL